MRKVLGPAGGYCLVTAGGQSRGTVTTEQGGLRPSLTAQGKEVPAARGPTAAPAPGTQEARAPRPRFARLPTKSTWEQLHMGRLSLAQGSGRDPPRSHVLPAPAGPALTRLGALRVPQLSLEAHPRELFGAGPLGCAQAGTRAVLAARGLPLGNPHGRERNDAPGSTHTATRQGTRGKRCSASRGPCPHVRRKRRALRGGRCQGRGCKGPDRRKGRVLGRGGAGTGRGGAGTGRGGAGPEGKPEAGSL